MSASRLLRIGSPLCRYSATPNSRLARLDAGEHEWASDPVVLGTSVAVSLLRQGAREILTASAV